MEFLFDCLKELLCLCSLCLLFFNCSKWNWAGVAYALRKILLWFVLLPHKIILKTHYLIYFCLLVMEFSLPHSLQFSENWKFQVLEEGREWDENPVFATFFCKTNIKEKMGWRKKKNSDVDKWKLGSQNRRGIKEELASGLTHSSSSILTFSGCKEFQGAK